jgi:hypothetical protein
MAFASRVLALPGWGALHMIPIAATLTARVVNEGWHR